MPTCHQKKNSRRHINTFCESDKNKNRCQNNDGKTTSQEQFIDQIDSKWRWILRNKENNKNKKSFIGFKSVAYLSSIKTRFNRSVARTVLFFCFSFLHIYWFTNAMHSFISFFFGTARCATDSLQLYAIRKMYIAEYQISLKLSEWKRHLIEWIRQNNKKYKQKPKKKVKSEKKM